MAGFLLAILPGKEYNGKANFLDTDQYTGAQNSI